MMSVTMRSHTVLPQDSLDMRVEEADNIMRGESETTEYDFSTDDESLR